MEQYQKEKSGDNGEYCCLEESYCTKPIIFHLEEKIQIIISMEDVKSRGSLHRKGSCWQNSLVSNLQLPLLRRVPAKSDNNQYQWMQAHKPEQHRHPSMHRIFRPCSWLACRKVHKQEGREYQDHIFWQPVLPTAIHAKASNQNPESQDCKRVWKFIKMMNLVDPAEASITCVTAWSKINRLKVSSYAYMMVLGTISHQRLYPLFMKIFFLSSIIFQ